MDVYEGPVFERYSSTFSSLFWEKKNRKRKAKNKEVKEKRNSTSSTNGHAFVSGVFQLWETKKHHLSFSRLSWIRAERARYYTGRVRMFGFVLSKKQNREYQW